MPEMPSEEDLIRIMSLTTEKRDRAIISLILSSGMQPHLIRSLTFDSVLKACDHLFSDDEPRAIEQLVTKDPVRDKSIAFFDIGTANSPRVTCCTPEALSLLFQQIYYRLRDDYGGNHVFLNNAGKNLTKNYVSDLLLKLRNQVQEYGDYDVPKINPTLLRKRFFYICDKYLNVQDSDKIITLMGGSRSASNKEFYDRVLEDKQILIEAYSTISDCLTLSKAGNRTKNNNLTADLSFNLY